MSLPTPTAAKLPSLIVHADWGVAAHKRWMASASYSESSGYLLHAAEPVGEPSSLFDRLHSQVEPNDTIFVGFDFPIGVPAEYAEAAKIPNFLDWLPQLGKGAWGNFFDVCREREEICFARPFYPFAPGGRRQQHLFDAIGVADIHALRRECERSTTERGPANPLFWTLGAKQVGKGALTGWRQVLAPALAAEQPISLWPFDGNLSELLSQPQIVVAETYPAEACVQLGMTAPSAATWNKRKQSDRRARGHELLRWAEGRRLSLHEDLKSQITDSFGDGKDGEDPFDAVIGLCAMVEVALGHRADGAPDSESVRQVEGWILGLEAASVLHERLPRRAARRVGKRCAVNT